MYTTPDIYIIKFETKSEGKETKFKTKQNQTFNRYTYKKRHRPNGSLRMSWTVIILCY